MLLIIDKVCKGLASISATRIWECVSLLHLAWNPAPLVYDALELCLQAVSAFVFSGQNCALKARFPDWLKPFKRLFLSPACNYGGPKQFSLVQSLSRVRLFATPLQRGVGLQHARPPCPSPTPRVYSSSCPLSWWCHPTISSSVLPFSCFQSFPASGSLPVSQLFTSGGQSVGVSTSTSVLPMNIQDWFPLGWTGLISLQSKGLSRVFSNTTVQKHQFFGTQLSL